MMVVKCDNFILDVKCV